MTVFLGSPALTTVAPLVSKDKGSLGNRINCAGSQAWNAIETGATAAGVVTIADYGLRHKDKLSKTYNGTKNIAQKIANSLKIQSFKKTSESIFQIRNCGSIFGALSQLQRKFVMIHEENEEKQLYINQLKNLHEN